MLTTLTFKMLKSLDTISTSMHKNSLILSKNEQLFTIAASFLVLVFFFFFYKICLEFKFQFNFNKLGVNHYSICLSLAIS